MSFVRRRRNRLVTSVVSLLLLFLGFQLIPAEAVIINTTVKTVYPKAGQVITGETILVSDGGYPSLKVFPDKVVFVIDGGSPLTAKKTIYGYLINWNSESVADGSHTIVSKATFGTTTVSSEPTQFTVSNVVTTMTPTVVKTVNPKMGQEVSGTVGLISDGGYPDKKIFPDKVVFTIDNGSPIVATKTIYGYIANWNSRAVPNGAHTVVSWASFGTQTVASSPILFSVKNTSITPVSSTWGSHMGISMGISKQNIDMAHALGVKWIRAGRDWGWGADSTVPTNIAYAHSLGMKFLWVCQKSAPHVYYESDVTGFANYCAKAVDYGVDAIEIGNEWNHQPFWQANPTGDYTLQAKITDATTLAIRAKSDTIPIMNSGWSPEGSPNTPQQAMGKLLDKAPLFKAEGTNIAHHAYDYSSPDILTEATWSAFLYGTKRVYEEAKLRGFNKNVWITEIGGPSAGSQDGVSFSLERQAQIYREYILGLGMLRDRSVPIDVVFWHTIQDGQSATNAIEQTFGLYNKDWRLKPAGQVVKDQASQPW